jgi:short-subunit dehydrogenase
VLAARRKDRLDALAAEVGNARPVAIDLSADGAADKLVGDVGCAGETFEILSNNAGVGQHGWFDKADAKRLRQMIDLKCGALTDLCRAVAPEMIQRGRGKILNVASTAAFQPGPGMAVYFATKAYVLSLSEALHEELKRFGISVTALCPGPTMTEFGEVAGFKTKQSLQRFFMDSEPVVRMGLQALERNKAVAIAGRLNAVGAFSTRFAPRSLVRKIAGSIKF